VKVLDFGVSKMLTDGPRTRTGVIKGKLPYMSPEQIRGDHLDGRADVFSLGVCAWEALAGRRLFERDTDFQIWKAITEQDVPFVRAHWPECPPLVDDVIRRALDRNRDHRPATAREFGRLLASAAGIAASSPEVSYVAEMVRLRCGEKIELRNQEVGAAVSSARASDTIKDGDMRLRSEARKLSRDDEAKDAASTVDQLPKREPEPAARAVSSRRPWLMMIVVAVLAAGIAAGVVAFVMSRQSSPVAQAPPDADNWGIGSAGQNLREGLEEVRKAGEDLRKLRDQFHGSN